MPYLIVDRCFLIFISDHFLKFCHCCFVFNVVRYKSDSIAVGCTIWKDTDTVYSIHAPRPSRFHNKHGVSVMF